MWPAADVQQVKCKHNARCSHNMVREGVPLWGQRATQESRPSGAHASPPEGAGQPAFGGSIQQVAAAH